MASRVVRRLIASGRRTRPLTVTVRKVTVASDEMPPGPPSPGGMMMPRRTMRPDTSAMREADVHEPQTPPETMPEAPEQVEPQDQVRDGLEALAGEGRQWAADLLARFNALLQRDQATAPAQGAEET